MKIIALRYSDTKLSSLSFDENATNQYLFETVKCTDKVPNTTVEKGSTLTGRQYSHIKWINQTIDVIISTDEIDDTSFGFLKLFWRSNFIYVSLSEGAVFGDYSQVITDGGKFPLTYIDNIRFFKEVEFSLTYSNPG